MASIASAQAPTMPPGVRLLGEPPAALAAPVDTIVRVIEVDWTDPRLRARLVTEPILENQPPTQWERAARRRPGALMIQLVEPVLEETGWRMAAPVGAQPEPPRPRAMGRDLHRVEHADAAEAAAPFDRALVGGIAPWIVEGPAVAAAGEAVSPLNEGSGWVGVRWLGRRDAWRARPPEIFITDRLLLSAFDPLTGRGAFIQATNRSTVRRLPATRLTDWLEAAYPAHVWIAVHAEGAGAVVGQGDWRWGERAPGVERVGAALALEAVAAGETVDWARLGNPQLRVSSAAPRHRLDTIVSGRLWPIPLAPPVWEARSTGPERERTAWLEMEVSGGRPVETIRLIFGSAAGWSAHFNPARVDVLIRRAGRSAFDPPIAIQDPSGAYSTIRFAQPTDVEELRLEFSRESRMGPIEPARLTAAQMLGPGR